MFLTKMSFRPAFFLLMLAAFLCGVAFAGSGNNAVPHIDAPLVPTSIKPGGSGFTLTVNGVGFVSGSVVNWNGSARVTTFVSKTQLTASILATDVAAKGTASVTVSSPAAGGGTSNVLFLSVVNQEPAVGLAVKGTCAGTPGVVADFNSDGKLDVGMLDLAFFDSVGIMLGRGDGTFKTKASYATAAVPWAAATGDFNSDGKLDLVITDVGNNFITVLLGKGDGTFTRGTPISTGKTPAGLAVGDFNEDGTLDLVVANEASGTVSFMSGNGDGTFKPSVDIQLANAGSLVAGDFNGDGHLDLAVAEPTGAIGVLLGNGDGTFQQPLTSIPAPAYATGLAAADFNGDGKLDLALALQGTSVAVFIGNGDGTFGFPVTYSVPGSALAVVAADFNGDGRLDLAVNQIGGGAPLNSMSILTGRGDGTFQLISTFASKGGYQGFAVGDFNGDGRLDLEDGCAVLRVPKAVQLTPPSSVSFGGQSVGTTSPPKQVKLTSVGPQTVTISSIGATGDFAQTNSCPATLAPNRGCFISVTFTPTATGTRTGQLIITDDAAGSPQVLTLSGKGVAPR